MKKNLHISTKIDKPGLLVNLVEKLAGRFVHNDPGYSKLPGELVTIGSSSAEVYVSGDLTLKTGKKDRVRIPFITSFYFTCTQSQGLENRLTWSSSLS